MDDVMTAIACNAQQMNNNKTWVDCDATKHMCTEQKAFTNLNKERQSIIYTTAKYITKSIGAGEIILNARLNKHKKNPAKLKDTLCVPGLQNNPLSVAKITDNGYTFKRHHATVNKPDGSIALAATKCNDLYIVNDRQERAILTSEKCDRELIKWH